MPFEPVTDANLLAQLNGGAQSAAPQWAPVTDPRILAELNGQPAKSAEPDEVRHPSGDQALTPEDWKRGNQNARAFVTGQWDPPYGINQLFQHVLHSVSPDIGGARNVTGPAMQRADEALAEREKDYQQSRVTPDNPNPQENTDWYRVAGNIASPVSLAGGEGGAAIMPNIPTALGRTIARGAGRGGGIAATEPVTDASDYWGTKGEQARAGATTGAIAEPVGAALGRILSADVMPAARRLYNQGVEVTPTQATGGIARSLTNKMTGLPVVGENIAENTANSLESFQRSRMNTALGHIGAPPMPADMELDRNALEHVSDTISRHFQQHIPNTIAGLDQQFNNDVGRIMADARTNLPTAEFNDLARIGRNHIQQPFGTVLQQTGNVNVPGEIAQQVDIRLGQLSRGLIKNPNNYSQMEGQYVRDLQEAYRDMLIRSSPADASQGVQDARRAWAEYVPIRDAAAMQGAEQGRFTPNQYKNAVRKQAPTIEQYATNTGPADFRARQQAAEDAALVLPNKVPNSGTDPRRAVTEGILALLAGHAIHPGLIAGVGGGMVATQPAASRLGTRILMNMPDHEALARIVRGIPATRAIIAGQNNQGGQ